MYKSLSKFANRLKGGQRRGRFTTKMVSSADVATTLRQIAPPAGAGPSLVWTEVRIITAAGLHHGPRGPVRRAG